MMHDGLLPAKIQDKLAAEFANATIAVASESGIPASAVRISPTELALALNEARKDLVIMTTRRIADNKDFKGLSIGKLAGILVFRLVRYRVIHVDTHQIDAEHSRTIKIASKLQEIAALRFASETILKVHPHVWHPELLYVLARRHINQEMLGVTFDVIATHCDRLPTNSPLDEPPFSEFYKRSA